MEKIHFKIKRQDHPDKDAYWEDIILTLKPESTIAEALGEICKNPVNQRGEAITPIQWESSCGEEMCGSCTMVINSRVALACGSKIKDLGNTITLEALGSFPLVRDLVVNRKRISEDYLKIKDWLPLERKTPISDEAILFSQKLSDCIHCGACLEVCPQYHDKNSFVGASTVTRALLLHELIPQSKSTQTRLNTLITSGSIQDCGNAQSCARACPKNIPLIEVWGKTKRQSARHFLKKIFG